MPKLPSGRLVQITSDRARHHAARLGLRIKKNTPLAQLYALVDILVEQPHAAGNGEKRLAFSGHTLADVKWIHKWDTRDRDAFMAWIHEPAQIGIIEQARRRLLADENQTRERTFDYPDRLYSPLRERVEQLALPRASAGQWRRTLLNLKKDGVGREELEWSGILSLLADLPDDWPIEQAVIADAMDFSAIRPRLSQDLICNQSCSLSFRKVAHKLKDYQLRMAGVPVKDGDIGVIRLISDTPSYKIGVVWPSGRTLGNRDNGTWFVLGRYGEALSDNTPGKRRLFSTQEDAVLAAQNHARRHNLVTCDLAGNSPYDYMTLDGGTQYREWLITLPEYPHTHFTGHYHARNILAHVRTKIRETQTGERVLFIEEMQSDWHQALAKRTTRGIVPRAPFRKEWHTLALKLMLLHVVDEGLDGIAWTDAAVHELRYDRTLPPLQRLYDKDIPAALNALVKPWGLAVGLGAFETRSPWLRAVRRYDTWRVEGGSGKFMTRPRFNKTQALALIKRHSKTVTLSLPMVLVNNALRTHIKGHGLPLFGMKPIFTNKG